MIQAAPHRFVSPERLDHARALLRQGRSLKETARAVDLTAAELDLALWNASKRFER